MVAIELPAPEVLWGPAPIDWCEPNRPSVNPFGIEELHNTWSNLMYVIVGILMFREYVYSMPAHKRDPIYFSFCINTIMTGITSGWFHATLIFIAQKSDEFFENAAVVSLMYFHVMPRNPSRPASGRYFIFSAHLTALALGVILIPELFCEVHLITVVLVCFGKALGSIKSTVDDETLKVKIISIFNK